MKTALIEATVLVALLALTGAAAEDYDPLILTDRVAAETLDLAVQDEARQREIPLRVYLPIGKEAAPLVLFSHGLGGTCKGNAYLGNHWSARGYVVVFLQHLGSDDSVWRDVPQAKRMAAMRQAVSAKNFLLRVQDVQSVLNQLEVWNKEESHSLLGRLDMAHIGMSGHSFGAATTQSVSGQSAGFVGQRFTDQRIDAAIAFSPNSPRRGDLAAAFGSVKVPWMLMTGTKDTGFISNATVASRLNVYPSLPTTIDKYEVVLHDAEHSAFGDRALPGDRETRNPNHHRVILALSTAFWDAYLNEDRAALQWLRAGGPPSVLEDQDRWQSAPGQ